MGIFEKAQIDFLTGFFMRESFSHFLEKAIREAGATSGVISLAMIDLDHFKHYNDKFGHDFGDEVLKYSASTIRLTMDENQTYFFRHGGDEFIVVFIGKSVKEAYQLLRSCRSNLLHRPFLLRNRFQKITMSIGVAGFPHDAQTVEELINRADAAMYYSKKHGRNRITLYNKIANLKARNAIIAILVAFIVAVSVAAFFRVGFVKDKLKDLSQLMRRMKIATHTENPDIVVLKNGTVFQGKIVAEDQKMVVMQLDLKQGEGTLKLEKSKIMKVKYAQPR